MVGYHHIAPIHHCHLSLGWGEVSDSQDRESFWTGYMLLWNPPCIPGGTAAKSLQSCPTLCVPIDGSPPGSPVPGILQARTLEWVAISFFNAYNGPSVCDNHNGLFIIKVFEKFVPKHSNCIFSLISSAIYCFFSEVK